MAEERRIEARVAGIYSLTKLIINKGSSEGVTVGMRFLIRPPSPLKVIDPDTKEELGELDRYKVKVEATSVEERFALCETYETRQIPGTSLPGLGAFSAGGFPSVIEPTRNVQVTLRKPEEGFVPLAPEDSYVQVGDRAIQLDESS